MDNLRFTANFIFESFWAPYKDRNREQQRFLAVFCLKSFAKGMVIANALTLLLYLPRFKTLRNSHLLKAQLAATCCSLPLTATFLEPLVSAHVFFTQFPLGLFEDQIKGPNGTLATDLLSASFFQQHKETL